MSNSPNEARYITIIPRKLGAAFLGGLACIVQLSQLYLQNHPL